MSYFVGICGGSGSGKTTLAKRLLEQFGPTNCEVISLDSYYVDLGDMPMEERSAYNYDHPDSIDTELLAADIDKLRQGKEVAVPTYDFATHSRLETVTLVQPKPVVIIEGILLFAFESIRQRLDYLVFRDCPEPTRYERRLERDVATRGRTPESVETQFATTVKPMHDLFVEPYKHKAHHITPHGRPLDEQVTYVEQFIRDASTKESLAVDDLSQS